MKTKELIDWLLNIEACVKKKHFFESIKMRAEIIKRLKEYEKLKRDCLRAQEYEVRGKQKGLCQ